MLFQAVEVIVATTKKPSLRGLAFRQVGRLFNVREANVLYLALPVFSRVLCPGRQIAGRTNGDSIALQRFKTQIVCCLSHRDSSIRRRALDVISALVRNCHQWVNHCGRVGRSVELLRKYLTVNKTPSTKVLWDHHFERMTTTRTCCKTCNV
jgi:hypothetical protein